MSYSPITDPQIYQTPQDRQQLNLLAVFHYVIGGLTLLGGFALLIYVVFGTVLLHGTMNVNANSKDPLPALVGGIFAGFGIICVLVCWLIGGLLVHTGRCLAGLKGQTFIYIVSALNCLNLPLGTALGVCTFIVLSRPTVKALFNPQLAMAGEISSPINPPWYRP